MKLLFITEKESLYRAIKEGKLKRADRVISFVEDLYISDVLKKKCIFVNNNGLTFKNFQIKKESIEKEYLLPAELAVVSLNEARYISPWIGKDDIHLFPRIIRLNGLLAFTALSVVFSLYNLYVNFNKIVEFNGEKYFLYEFLFLPVVSYIVLNEYEMNTKFILKPVKEVKECINLSLSYLLGSKGFERILNINLSILKKYGII